MLITNNTQEIITTGNHFIIDKWNGKKWLKEKVRTDWIFTDIGYTLNPGEYKILETDIFGYFPDLKKGIYKISKSYFYEKDIPITIDEKQWISQEFQID